MAAMPIACGSDTSEVDGTTTDPSTGTTLPDPDGSSSGGSTAPEGTGESSTSADASSIGPETTESSSGTTGDGSSSSSSDDGTSSETTTAVESSSSSGVMMEESSSTTEPLTECEQWAQAFDDCYPMNYTLGYLEAYCTSSLYNVAPCPMESAAVVVCEGTMGGPCADACGPEEDALEACENEAQAQELGCYDLPVLMPADTIDMQCFDIAAAAFECGTMGYYIGGFTQYMDYDDPIAIMQAHCVGGAYWLFSFDPDTSCGAAYEELLTCISGLTCDELEDAVYPFGSYCADEQVAIECKCELGIN